MLFPAVAWMFTPPWWKQLTLFILSLLFAWDGSPILVKPVFLIIPLAIPAYLDLNLFPYFSLDTLHIGIHIHVIFM